MKMIYIILGFVIIGVLTHYLLERKGKALPGEKEVQLQNEPNGNPYLGLREQIFNTTPAQLGIAISEHEKAYAVIMDVSLGVDGTMTLVSVIDGNASIYLSSGGGVIGGVSHETVRKAAIDFVAEGERHISQMNAVAKFPLPQTDNVRFFVLTNRGKYSIEEPMANIESGKSDWLPLFSAGDNVIAELRLTTMQK